MTSPYQRLEATDLFDCTRVATFERPHAHDTTIIITVPPGADFHIDAGTLKVIAEVLATSPSKKEIV